MNLDHWQHYADCWSMAEGDRPDALDAYAATDVVYRDPTIEVQGADALSAYMGGFQEAFPGHRFAIVAVAAHHDRSLAHWEQVAPDGVVAMSGASAARHAPDGQMLEITGFFLP
jgi:hypothetical protein